MTLTGVQGPLIDTSHDESFHLGLNDQPHRFCAPTAMVTDIAVHGDDVTFCWVAVPYCRRDAIAGVRQLGWNVVVTVDDGTNVVVTVRHPLLTHGGLWTVSATEGAEPDDMIPVAGRLAVGSIAARALSEELGLFADPDRLDDLIATRAVFRVDGHFGVLFHVPGEQLGWTGDQVLHAHSTAIDRWEGTPHIVALNHKTLTAVTARSGWTPCARPCIDVVAGW